MLRKYLYRKDPSVLLPFPFQVYVNQLTAEERSKIIKLTEKHCKQMLDMIYKQKMAYFKSGGDDWREVLERSYPRDPPSGILLLKALE